MGFLNSWVLWATLAQLAIAVPVLIHLLYRQHRQETRWAAMELLRRAVIIRSGQVKLENFLILFLRCLALLLIAAALLRPILWSDSTPLLGKKRVGVVIAIDASLSMNHGELTRFEQAIRATKEILKKTGEGEPVSVVLMSNRPRILLRRSDYNPSTFEALLNKEAKATPYRLNLDQNLAQLQELVAELKTPIRECYLITDGQESDWKNLSDKTKEAFAQLKQMAGVFVVPVEVENENNASLTDLGYASGSLHRSGSARIVAKVRNESRRRIDPGNIEFYVGNALVTRKPVGPLEPGESRPVSFFTSFETTGDVPIRAHLSKDNLIEDNDRFAVVHIHPQIRVLCADDARPVERAARRSGTYYAVRALRLLGRGGKEPIQVNQIQAADLSLENLSDYDVLLLANVADLAPEMVQRIDRFVRQGGGLILFAGDRVTAEIYNKRFGFGPKGLLPGELGGMLKSPSQVGFQLGESRSDHPLNGIIKRLPPAIIESARFSKVIESKPVPGAQTIASLAKPSIPLLLSREVGSGSVLLFATSADRSWTQLPIHPLYTMLLQQAVTNMTSRPEARNVLVGGSAKVPVRGHRVGDRARVTDPQKQSRGLKVTQGDQLPVCAVQTDHVGIYTVATGTEGNAPETLIAANVDPTESNIRVVEPSVIASALEPLGTKVIRQDGLDAAIEESRRGWELGTILLICGIIIFILQSLLAKYFTNRISQPSVDVAASLEMSRVAAARRS